MSNSIPQESCFWTAKHSAHTWTYSAAGSHAPFSCPGVAK